MLQVILLLLLLLLSSSSSISSNRRLAITTYGTIDYSCLQTNSWVTGSTYYNSIFGKITDIINITYVSSSSDFQIGYYGIPNYGRIFDSSIMAALATHKSMKATDFANPRTGTTATLDEVYEFGADIGYAISKGACLGYWPPGPSCPGISFKTELVSLLPSPETETKGCYALSGAQGTWVNGVLIYVWGDGNTYNDSGVWSQLAMEFEKYAMDVCTGHAAGSAGYYHHHSYSSCLASQLQDDGTKHSPIYGWVNDGYPIYGPYQSNGVLAKSCWQKRDYSSSTTGCSDGKRSCLFVDEYDYTKGTTTASSDGPDPTGTTTSTTVTISAASGIYYQDYYYNSTCGNLGGAYLNSYNGHDHDDLGFHYHVTIDSSINNEFPYTFGPKFYGCTDSCCTSIKADNTCKSAKKSTCSSSTQGIALSNAQCLDGISTETFKPTAIPTNSPTTSKPSTRIPTCKPSFKPTGPSYSPTRKPSTVMPTSMPSTHIPSHVPTFIPTLNPSEEPTIAPIIGTKTEINFVSNIKLSNITSAVASTNEFSNDFLNAISTIVFEENIPVSEIKIANSPNSSNSINIRILNKSMLLNSNIVKSGAECTVVYFTMMIILENTIYTSSNLLQNALESIISTSCSDGDLISYLAEYNISASSSSPISISSETTLNDDDISTVRHHDLSMVFFVAIIIASLGFCAIVSYMCKKWGKSFATNLDQLDTTNSDVRPSIYDDESNNRFIQKISNPILQQNAKSKVFGIDNDERPSEFDVGDVYADNENIQRSPSSESDLVSKYAKHISNDRLKKVSKNDVVGDGVDDYRPSNFEIGAHI